MKMRFKKGYLCLLLISGIAMVSCKKEERKDINAPLVNIQKKVAPAIATSDLDLNFDEEEEADIPEIEDTGVVQDSTVNVEELEEKATTEKK